MLFSDRNPPRCPKPKLGEWLATAYSSMYELCRNEDFSQGLGFNVKFNDVTEVHSGREIFSRDLTRTKDIRKLQLADKSVYRTVLGKREAPRIYQQTRIETICQYGEIGTRLANKLSPAFSHLTSCTRIAKIRGTVNSSSSAVRFAKEL